MSKSKSIATLVIHAGDQVDRGNKALLQIVGGDKLIIPFC